MNTPRNTGRQVKRAVAVALTLTAAGIAPAFAQDAAEEGKPPEM